MASFTVTNWKAASGGSWTVAANWDNGVPLTSSSFANLGALGAAYTVVLSSNATVGLMRVGAGATLSLTAAKLSVASSVSSSNVIQLAGTIAVGAGGSLSLGLSSDPLTTASAISGPGAIQLASSGVAATLTFADSWAGLVAGAQVALSGAARVLGSLGSATTFENVSGVLSGDGVVGNGATAPGVGLTLVNDYRGLVNATGGALRTLTLNTGAHVIRNAGVLEATGAGGLVIASPLTNNGRLLALGAGGVTLANAPATGLGAASVGSSLTLHNAGLRLSGGVSIAAGATLTTSAGDLASVKADNADKGDFLASATTNAGEIRVVDRSTLSLNARIDNSGEISLLAAADRTALTVYGYRADIEGGAVTLSDSAANAIVSNGAAVRLRLNANLSGSGVIGDGWLALAVGAAGVVNSSGTKGLTLVGGAAPGNVNAGLIETTGGGGMFVTGALANVGVLGADGAGALTLRAAQLQSLGGAGRIEVAGSLVLAAGTSVQGQTLAVAATGKVRTTAGDQGAKTDSFTGFFGNAGGVTVVGGSALALAGTLSNSGTVVLDGASQSATLVAQGGLRLGGGGSVLLNGASAAVLSGAAGAYVENNSCIIAGGGLLGDSRMSLVNGQGGTVDARSPTTALTLASATAGVVNNGLIKSTGAAGLVVTGALHNNGQLAALGAGGVTLANGSVDGGGSLTVAKGSKLVLKNSGVAYQSGVTIGSASQPGGLLTTSSGDTAAIGTSNALAGDYLINQIRNFGTLAIADNSRLNFSGTLIQQGALTLSASAYAATLELFGYDSDIEGGSVVLSDNPGNAIVSNGAAVTLTLNASLSGSGVIGDGSLALAVGASGTVNASGAGGLTIRGGAGRINSSSGLVETTGAGGLTVAGPFVNLGTMLASGAGALTLNGAGVQTYGAQSEIRVGGAGTLKLLAGASVSGGRIDIASGGKLLTTAGDKGAAADALAADAVNAGLIDVAGDSSLTMSDDLVNNGQLLLDGASAAAALQVKDSLTLLGPGSLVLSGTHAAIVSAGAGAYLENDSETIMGSGAIGDALMSIVNGLNGVIDANASAGLTVAFQYLSNAGLIASHSPHGLVLSGPSAIDNEGAIAANSGGDVYIAGGVSGQGVLQINGAGTMEIGGGAANAMLFSAGGTGRLIFDQSSQVQGQIAGFAAGDAIDLRDFAYVAGNMALGPLSSFGPADGHLQIANGTGFSNPLWLEGDYAPDDLKAKGLAFAFSDDGYRIGTTSSDGTLVRLVAA